MNFLFKRVEGLLPEVAGGSLAAPRAAIKKAARLPGRLFMTGVAVISTNLSFGSSPIQSAARPQGLVHFSLN